jgi:hypothetical protein
MVGYCEQWIEIMAVPCCGMLLEYNSIICLEALKKFTGILSRAERLLKGMSSPDLSLGTSAACPENSLP